MGPLTRCHITRHPLTTTHLPPQQPAAALSNIPYLRLGDCRIPTHVHTTSMRRRSVVTTALHRRRIVKIRREREQLQFLLLVGGQRFRSNATSHCASKYPRYETCFPGTFIPNSKPYTYQPDLAPKLSIYFTQVNTPVIYTGTWKDDAGQRFLGVRR